MPPPHPKNIPGSSVLDSETALVLDTTCSQSRATPEALTQFRTSIASALQRHFQLGFLGETVQLPLAGGGQLQSSRVVGQGQPAGLHEQLQ